VLRESGDNLQYFLVSLERLFLMAGKKKGGRGGAEKSFA